MPARIPAIKRRLIGSSVSLATLKRTGSKVMRRLDGAMKETLLNPEVPFSFRFRLGGNQHSSFLFSFFCLSV